MKRRRLAAAVVVILALVFSFPASAKVTITFRHWNSNAGIDGTWQKFNESQDEIEVVFAHTSFGQYIDKTLVEMATGEGPDIFSLQDWPYAEMSIDAWAKNGQLLDLTPYWERDKDELEGSRWHPFLIEFATRGGMLVGMPYGWNIGEVLNYNADRFLEMGVAFPDDTWTWTDVAETARKMTRLDAQGSPEVIGLESTFTFEYWFDVENRVRAGGGSLFNEDQTRSALRSPASRRVLELMADLANNVAYRASSAWGAGNVAMRTAGIGRAIADKELYNIAFTSGMAPGPRDPVTNERYSAVGVLLFGVNPNTKHPEAVWEALKFFVKNYGEQALRAAGYIQFVPVIPSEQSLFFSQPPETVGDLIATQMEPVVLTLMQTAHVPEKAINPIVGERSADIGNVLNNEWIRVVRGELPLYDFIENVSDRIDAILQGL